MILCFDVDLIYSDTGGIAMTDDSETLTLGSCEANSTIPSSEGIAISCFVQ